MSALGQKQTWPSGADDARLTSKAYVVATQTDVCFARSGNSTLLLNLRAPSFDGIPRIVRMNYLELSEIALDPSPIAPYGIAV
jgi:hypothetical protein